MGIKGKIQQKFFNYVSGNVADLIHTNLAAYRDSFEEEDFSHLVPLDYLNLRSYGGLSEAYNTCSVVATVLNRVARALTNGKLIIRDKRTKVETTYAYSKILKVLEAPNSRQTFNQFLEELKVTASLYGFAYVYTPKVIGLTGIRTMHVINPNLVYFKYEKTDSVEELVDRKPVAAAIHLLGTKRHVEVDELHKFVDHADVTELDRDINTSLQWEVNKPSSRLAPLKFEVQNIIQAQEAIYSLNRDRGAQGVLSNDKKDAAGYLPLTAEEKASLNREYSKSYGLRNSTKKVIITDASVKWQPMSYSVKDLMLFDGIKSNMCSIADAYDYPFELLANDKGSTFSNKDASMKGLYQDNIVPAAAKISEFLGKIFALRSGHEFYFDYDELYIMQEAAKDRAVALRGMAQAMHVMYQNRVITAEEFRRACDMSEEVYGDTYIDPVYLGAGGINISNQAPAGTSINSNNDSNHNE